MLYLNCVLLPHGSSLCLFSHQPRFILEGSLEILDQGQNARFGSALAPVPDLNGDSFNDVVVGAPLEDDHKGAIYIYYSQRNRILRKYKQVPHKCPAVLLCIHYLNVFGLNSYLFYTHLLSVRGLLQFSWPRVCSTLVVVSMAIWI